jgi:glutamate dehydrogenase
VAVVMVRTRRSLPSASTWIVSWTCCCPTTKFGTTCDRCVVAVVPVSLAVARGCSSLTQRATCVGACAQEEILFFGPDENTADFMDWACEHARERGYKFWKAFTTGKGLFLGGIPHDVYGMTTHGVRQYALGVQEKLGLVGSECTKVQTGGPDGDLGSNEILMGNEKTIAVVDGSGVLFDPQGINHDELARLARGRLMVKFVDPSKISSQGRLVLVEDKVWLRARARVCVCVCVCVCMCMYVYVCPVVLYPSRGRRGTVCRQDVILPDGTLVESGMVFRNNFHLSHLSRGDFFIPW